PGGARRAAATDRWAVRPLSVKTRPSMPARAAASAKPCTARRLPPLAITSRCMASILPGRAGQVGEDLGHLGRQVLAVGAVPLVHAGAVPPSGTVVRWRRVEEG